ncbi:hypothetical protein AAHB37_05060 [Glutamicibacter halophytocola]|uniref:hypothetical protein n=1 Tax=Glutamicibacter halophytocola TaxID=1933880 RepID=UPI0032192DCF
MATSLARFQRDAITAVVGLSGFAVEPRDLEIFDDASSATQSHSTVLGQGSGRSGDHPGQD